MTDFWETAQWWNWKPETHLGIGGKVSVVIINLLVFTFVLAAFLITH